jgi:hypothetical protein
MTCVALDKNNRPSPGLPKLYDPNDDAYVKKLQETTALRKDLADRWQKVQDLVDNLPFISREMLHVFEYNQKSVYIPVSETVIEVQNSFLPKHLNRNGTIFGGEVLSWMVCFL